MQHLTSLIALSALVFGFQAVQTEATESAPATPEITPGLDANGVWLGNQSIIANDLHDGQERWLATKDGTTWHSIPAQESGETLYDWKTRALATTGTPRVTLTIPRDMDVGRIGAVTVVTDRTAIAAVETTAGAASYVTIPNATGLIRTEDGGHHWVWMLAPGKFPAPLFNEYCFDALYFRTAQCGWITATDAGLFHTTDGGATWKAIHTPDLYATDPFFKNELEGRIIGRKTRQVYETKDGGTTWRNLSDDEVLAPGFSDYFQEAPIAQWNDYAVLRAVLKTFHPEIWPGADTASPPKSPVLLDQRNASSQWLTTEDGKMWRRVQTPVDFTHTELWNLSVLTDGTWLASSADQIVLSHDQGRHWLQGSVNSQAVAYSDPIALTRLSQFGSLKVTNGNVVELTMPAKVKFDGVEAVSILSNTTATAIVNVLDKNAQNSDLPTIEYGIIQTTDAGKSWQWMTNPKWKSGLYDCDHLFACTLKDAWASSDNSDGLQHTTDGGKTWHNVAIPDRSGGVMYFKNEREGRVLGGSTTLVYETKDGGKTWRTLTDAEVADTSFLDYFQGEPTYRWDAFVAYRMILLNLPSDLRHAQLAEVAAWR